MTALIVIVGVIAFAGLFFWYFLTASPHQVATTLRYVVPGLVAALGLVMTLIGRVSLGLPLLGFAFAMWARIRRTRTAGPSRGRRSTVRSAMLDMELDHDTGDMNGVVIAGNFEGRELDAMSEEELIELADEVEQDPESAQLFEAYLDRRMPGWREGENADAGTRHAGTAQTGAMTEQEAYQLLGLEAGATVVDIRDAHRRLIQRVHPDVGGSSFLAARINEAKDVLLRLHDV